MSTTAHTTTETASALISKAATTATYTGSASAVIFGLSANEFAALSGVVIALAGLLVNIWFKAQHLKLARQKAEANEDE